MSVADTADVAERVRTAHASSTALRIVGAGSWLDAGAPCMATDQLSVAGLTGIMEYEPGDLTLTARAGTSLEDLERATAAHGQWLPLEPFGTGGTIGATVATASYGPLVAAFGTPRDQVLGCQVVTGRGAVIRAGGRVVKNVAGFDITRLMVGAWGTLGVLTEVTVRLRARPEAEATIAVALAGRQAVEHAARWLRTSELTPFAAELLSPILAARLGVPAANATVLLLRLGGNPAYLAAALRRATALGDTQAFDTAIWHALAVIGASGGATMRVSVAPADVGPLWDGARDAVEAVGGLSHATLARGVVRCILPVAHEPEASATLTGVVRRLPACTCILERAPAPAWAPLAVDPVTDVLSLGVRRTFDPGNLLNPGILGTLSAGLS